MSYTGILREDKELVFENRDILIYATKDYAKKIYRNLMALGRHNDVKAFIDCNKEEYNIFCGN